ncbi:putative ABC transport system permease protein [Neolewinella xylanilytica]|uniref:Putative ABC transport system permease protein n=1 Tax=Neolewinella xylanilytica TaxID=1514080 RepID=A0A2S6I720_9BACT|nr:FtsX-like permease family protein [Neolewinella xylanilytica]PPK87280.1 putative ABC transport system permease protein [Neolewinella xylanilytica]
MLNHLLKLMWNKRRSNGLIFLEILLAFVVLFGVYAFGFYNLDRYSSPLGFSYENSVGVHMDIPDDMDSLAVIQLQERILRETRELPGVASATFLGPVNPFGGNTWSTGSDDNGFHLQTMMVFADENYAETLELEFREGHWFTEADQAGKYDPIVVNGKFVDEYYPTRESMIDSIILINGEKKIIGVVDNYKYHSNFAENRPLTFFSPRSWRADGQSPFEQMIVRAEPGQTAAIEEPIYNLLSSLTKNPDVVIWNMAQDRIKANRPVVIPLVILISISAFLLINIALGLFGVLFTQISHRRAEIGLRKAMGATPGEVTVQFVLEVVLVTFAGLLLGVFFAVQVPLLELLPIPAKFFYFGIVAAVVTILLIVVLCALIPSRQAAGLHPALVLHED